MTRGSSSWTSPPPVWIRRRDARCGRSSPPSAGRAAPSSSPPTIWKRRSTSATGWRSWTTGGSWPTTVPGLIRAHAPGTTVSVSPGGGQVQFDGLPGVRTVQQADGEVILITSDPLRTVQALLELNRSGQVIFHQLRVEEATLEDVFLHLTGRRLRE